MLRLSRIAALSAVLAVSSLGTAVALSAGTASASAPTVTCTTFSVTANKAQTSATGTVSGCTPSASTGGKATVKSTQSVKTLKGSATITWSGKGTTTTTFTFALNPKGAKATCPKGDVLVKEVSTTTGGTDKAIAKGQVATDYLCSVAATGKTSLASGQKYTV